MKRKIVWLGALCLCASTVFGSERVRAFCGFYVAGGNAELFADASMVVMMRNGTTTVLSMQNDYRGPPENFALIVPVPEVLDESRVHTLPREVFDRVDQLASPRLVEYWEMDPCQFERPTGQFDDEVMYESGAVPEPTAVAADLGVTVEAEFAVGEYQIVILSAADSSGLETWLRQENYNIPDGAEARLRPYVEAGSKFFVAKVDVSKVTFGEEGVAQLSPLRVHYTSEAFELPIRLGLVNAAGAQDLIVHVLARNQRFELANRPNVTIPTNIDVDDSVRDRFGPFYVALFDETVRRNPGAVVTEYAWQATNCDPCPGPVLSVEDLTLLGGDVVDAAGSNGEPVRRPSGWGNDFVLTRLHARYEASAVEDDLVFRAANAIVGGREFNHGPNGLEHGSRPDTANNFQGRYAIRHAWDKPITCENPVRGRWGGPWDNEAEPQTRAAGDLAYADRDAVQLPEAVRSRVPELELAASAAFAGAAPTNALTQGEADDDADQAGATEEEDDGCGCRTTRGSDALWLLALGAVLLARRRRI